MCCLWRREAMQSWIAHKAALPHSGCLAMLFCVLQACGTAAFLLPSWATSTLSHSRHYGSCRPTGCVVLRPAAPTIRVTMTAGDDAQESIRERMASEFDRITEALKQIDQLGQAEQASAGPSLFTPKELAAIEMLGQDSAPASAVDGIGEREESPSSGSTISCGGEAYSSVGHSAVVTGDGRVFTWGSGAGGRLGAASEDSASSPIEVGGLLTIVRREGIRVRAISCGYDHSACVTEDGRVFVWGSGARGQLGLGNLEPQSTPQEVGPPTRKNTGKRMSYAMALFRNNTGKRLSSAMALFLCRSAGRSRAKWQ